MHDNLWCELEEDELEQAQGESEAGPVGSVLEDLEAVAIELNVAVKVHVVESLHWDLGLSAVLETVGLILEGEVMLNWATWGSRLLVLARAEAGHDSPKANENWNGCEQGKEDHGLQASTDLPCRVCWHNE